MKTKICSKLIYALWCLPTFAIFNQAFYNKNLQCDRTLRVENRLAMSKKVLNTTIPYSNVFWITRKFLSHDIFFMISKRKMSSLILFDDQCSIINRKSLLFTEFNFLSENCLSALKFTFKNISKILQNFIPSKAPGHDKISIRMPKAYRKKLFILISMIVYQLVNFLRWQAVS